MIDDVLDVSRITSGKLRLNVAAVELREMLAERGQHDQAGRGREGGRRRDAGRRRRSCRVRRSRSAPADRVEPALERGEVHAARRPRAAAPRGNRLLRRDRREGRWPGDRSRVPAARLRAIPAGRQPILTRSTAGLDSGWRSCASWSSCMAGRSSRRARARAQARPSPSGCPPRWKPFRNRASRVDVRTAGRNPPGCPRPQQCSIRPPRRR